MSLFILPYLSIDLFFVAAPFLLRTDRELKVFVGRIATAIIVAAIFFLTWPLRIAFARPHPAGWTGWLFDRFLDLDAPYNLFPSLHAALWLLLLQVYRRHLHGVVLWLTMLWFGLIALSPLLTHQHHVIDIAGGLLLGFACSFFWSEKVWPARTRVTKRPKRPLLHKP